jgi:hypothetical protein
MFVTNDKDTGSFNAMKQKLNRHSIRNLERVHKRGDLRAVLWFVEVVGIN